MPRSPLARLARLRLAGVVATLAVGAAMLTVPTAAVSSEPAAFHPQLVTVDTPFRSDKERLQTLGLDLTEHAGHDYVEVVIHTPRGPEPADQRPGSPTTSGSPT